MRALVIGLAVVVVALMGALVGILSQSMFTTSPTTEVHQSTDEEFAERVRVALVNQPEILQEVFYVLETRTRDDELASLQDAVSRNYALIESAPAAFIGGNPEGDVTIVEFFDYECGYCRRALPEFAAFLEADTNVRVIYFEMPILGERSQRASLMALAADRQGRYEDFHRATLAMSGQLTDDVLFEIAARIGLNREQLDIDLMDPELSRRINDNLMLARAMQINSTPTFLVGGQVSLGWNHDRITAQLETARGE